jgi:hypothetical protein
MLPGALGIHLDIEFRVVFTVVIAVAACVAGWRLTRSALRRWRDRP